MDELDKPVDALGKLRRQEKDSYSKAEHDEWKKSVRHAIRRFAEVAGKSANTSAAYGGTALSDSSDSVPAFKNIKEDRSNS